MTKTKTHIRHRNCKTEKNMPFAEWLEKELHLTPLQCRNISVLWEVMEEEANKANIFIQATFTEGNKITKKETKIHARLQDEVNRLYDKALVERDRQKSLGEEFEEMMRKP